jgi:hypothetical protein
MLVPYGGRRSRAVIEVFQPLAPNQAPGAAPQPLCMCCGRPSKFTGSPRTLSDLLCSPDCLTFFNCRRKGGLRRMVEERDRGVCEVCALDCQRLVEISVSERSAVS